MNFLRRLFGKAPLTPSAPEDRRDMNEDWQAGDLAVCVNDDWVTGGLGAPNLGDVLRVSSVLDGVGESGCRAFYLRFDGRPYSWAVVAFRKVRLDHRAAETEFTQQIKRLGKTPTHVS